jgi:hypothetical protein
MMDFLFDGIAAYFLWIYQSLITGFSSHLFTMVVYTLSFSSVSRVSSVGSGAGSVFSVLLAMAGRVAYAREFLLNFTVPSTGSKFIHFKKF